MAVSLQKGGRISLAKDNGEALRNVCIGVNWGAIKKKSWFGADKTESVDLDASVGLVGANKTIVDTVFFGQKKSKCGSILHSGDDLTGDTDGDDGLDNEIITVDLTKLNGGVDNLIFVLNSFRGHEFGSVPYARIRIYEGTPNRVDNVLATFDIVNDAKFSKSTGMIMGRLYRHNSEWKFQAQGEALGRSQLKETLASAVSMLS